MSAFVGLLANQLAYQVINQEYSPRTEERPPFWSVSKRRGTPKFGQHRCSLWGCFLDEEMVMQMRMTPFECLNFVHCIPQLKRPLLRALCFQYGSFDGSR